MSTDHPAPTHPIVLIHGLWMTPRSWENWVDRYTSRGYQVIAAPWPALDGHIDALRHDPGAIARLTIEVIVAHYERLIRELAQPPIIMGHSFGGAFVQILLDRRLGAAGVAIDSAPTRGVRKLPLSTLRATWPVLHNPANRHRAVSLTPGQFHYAFTNTLSAAQSAQVYQRYQVPGPGHVLFEGALANLDAHSALRVDYDNNERAPLLFIAGGADHLVPAPVNRANATLHRRSRALTGYREFPGRSHYTLGQDGWEELADYAVDWATKNATRTRSGDDHEPPAASR